MINLDQLITERIRTINYRMQLIAALPAYIFADFHSDCRRFFTDFQRHATMPFSSNPRLQCCFQGSRLLYFVSVEKFVLDTQTDLQQTIQYGIIVTCTP